MIGVKRLTWVTVIVVLIAVNVVLVGIVLLRHHHSKDDGTVIPPTQNAAPSTPAISVSQRAAAAKAASRTPQPVLSVAGKGSAVYAVAGCHQAPHLKVSVTGGAQWEPVPAPAPHVLGVQLLGKKSGFITGANAACQATLYTPDGAGWTPLALASKVWYAAPDGVHTPTGSVTKPCGRSVPGPVSLADSGKLDAIVICRTGVYLTTSGGRHWIVSGPLPAGHPASVGLTTRGRGAMLLAGTSGCTGLRVAFTRDGGLSWTPSSCLTQLQSPAAIALGTNGAGLATSGQSVRYFTVDGGQSWN